METKAMALVSCPECHKEVSTEAWACPQCAFPFPGKKGSQEDRSTARLNRCPQCDDPVSQYVQKCPHCGVSLIGEHTLPRNGGEATRETCLCPHCGLSHTRKVPQPVQERAGIKDAMPSATTGNPLKTAGIRDSHADTYRNDPAIQASKRRSPLWQDPSVPKEVSSPRIRRNNKNSLIVGLILVVIVVMSVAFGAIWQLKGLNPLEAILYWGM
jgi:hypothetical protein